jgi:ABC-type amino acid transport substrate-binding protein
MRVFAIVVLLLVSVAGVVWYYHYKQYMPDTRMLIVGTSADFPPLAFKKHDKFVGFDIELITEVARRLGKELVLKDMPFEMLIPQLQLGVLHVVAAGMTPTAARAQRVLFTESYLDGDSLQVITRADTRPIESLADLNNKEVVVNQGYMADTVMSAQQGSLLRRLPTIADALLALKSGRAYAFVTSSTTLKPIFEQVDRSEFNVFTIPHTQEPIALAISTSYLQLAKQIDSVLKDMKQDGTLELFKSRWQVV